MCTGIELAMLASSAVGAAASVMNRPDKALNPDPKEERAKAEAEATQKANAKLSMQRKAMRENSLLTGAGTLGAEASRPAQGRSTLGV